MRFEESHKQSIQSALNCRLPLLAKLGPRRAQARGPLCVDCVVQLSTSTADLIVERICVGGECIVRLRVLALVVLR